MKLEIVPIKQSDAKAFVKQHHRHLVSPVGSIFQVACSDGEQIVGVAMVGRPVSRVLDDGWTVEVTRLCSDGTKNVCSKLYAACRKLARLFGYRKIVTYTLESEPGTSVKAAGWTMKSKTLGGSWDCKSRPRVDNHPTEPKFKWESILT